VETLGHGKFQPRCPTCDLLVDAELTNKFLPFCSQRCRLIDLGRWLNEEHRLTCEDDDQEPNSPTPGAVTLPPGWHDA